ncbi:extracellular solute-binding protein [Paenibacillus beijingensis]|uniref:Sugar ABC transporter substrate-binding protein n=1 Tax=Paenibacillus beijingensis TaxID=1126833 RepID=A0A0D5NF48_9BACL|nr:extracellular solute-binding protein [Paenibacillus beijingensis]AJY73543.1 sugar ABC transporter substrate-binding protein [Paenibacillus beijingensis]
MVGIKRNIVVLLAVSLVALNACSSWGHSGADSNRNPVENSTAAAAADADPFGKYNYPVTLKIGIGVDPSFRSSKGETPANNIWVAAIKENLNVDIKIAWQVANPNLSQKVSLSIASDDLPDAMVVDSIQLNHMAKAGQLADLTEAYHKAASPVMKRIMNSADGIALKSVTFDGKMLALPSVDAEDMSMMWIRKDWLDKLGLQPPKTMDELERAAKAFVENDPDGNGKRDTIGITAGGPLYDDFTYGPGSFTLDPIFAAYKSYPGFWREGTDGRPVYGSILPETKAALAKIRDLYAKGLIDKDIGIHKAPEEVVINGSTGIFFLPFYGGYTPLPEVLKNNPDANWQAYALPLDADGKFNAKAFNPSKTFVVVRKGYGHPEAVIRIHNLILRDEVKYGFDYQPLRSVLAPRDEIAFSVQALQEVLSGAKTPEDFADKEEYKLLKHDLATIKNAKLEPYDHTDIQYWNIADKDFPRAYSLMVGGRNLLDRNINKIRSVSYLRTRTVESKWANLKKLESEAFIKIILGSAPIDSFDTFVRAWKTQGGDQIAKEMAESLNR